MLYYSLRQWLCLKVNLSNRYFRVHDAKPSSPYTFSGESLTCPEGAVSEGAGALDPLSWLPLHLCEADGSPPQWQKVSRSGHGATETAPGVTPSLWLGVSKLRRLLPWFGKITFKLLKSNLSLPKVYHAQGIINLIQFTFHSALFEVCYWTLGGVGAQKWKDEAPLPPDSLWRGSQAFTRMPFLLDLEGTTGNQV